MREQLVEALINRLDAFGWQTFQRLGRNLPRSLQPPLIAIGSESENSDDGSLLDLEPIRQLIAILQNLPGFTPELVLSRLPRLIREPDTHKMGIKVAQGLAERGVVRLVKVAAGVSP